jgi:holo-[acyl-carrier protein] synthase
MIVGIGIDAVTVSRLERWAANPSIMERFFDSREIATVRERGKGMVRSLAVRFAAKEAFCKALGTGLAGISLKDIMVLNSQDKKPEIKVEGSALAAMKAAGAEKVFVSLTHEGDMAIASVVLEA